MRGSVVAPLVRIVPVGLVTLSVQRVVFANHPIHDVRLQLVLALVVAAGAGGGSGRARTGRAVSPPWAAGVAAVRPRAEPIAAAGALSAVAEVATAASLAEGADVVWAGREQAVRNSTARTAKVLFTKHLTD